MNQEQKEAKAERERRAVEAVTEHFMKTGQPATTADVAAITGWSESKVRRALVDDSRGGGAPDALSMTDAVYNRIDSNYRGVIDQRLRAAWRPSVDTLRRRLNDLADKATAVTDRMPSWSGRDGGTDWPDRTDALDAAVAVARGTLTITDADGVAVDGPKRFKATAGIDDLVDAVLADHDGFGRGASKVVKDLALKLKALRS